MFFPNKNLKPNSNTNSQKSQFNNHQPNQLPNYLFMKDNSLWVFKKEEQKKILLQDLEVLLEHGKEGIKKALIENGFEPGTKIIDIKRFTGLSEHGFTITTFLVQNENGGEIRAVSINIDLGKMTFKVTMNNYFSSGKEPYFYLKKEKGIVTK